MYHKQPSQPLQQHKITVIPSRKNTRSLLLNSRDTHCPLNQSDTEFARVRHDAYLLKNEIYPG
ncbi:MULTISPECIES: hypothetical protein [Aliamphritea]|uniref:hypothetical protein n=1 Tax=Aliamphritea TaxID=3018276 RepID=UPI00196A575B|nr:MULTISPECIES: hypothetical protein [Aliamphritea]MBN3564838.1 hypothetical protein [Aliamphritea spongicola]